MNQNGSKRMNMAVALVAAYMLVLQMLFGAFALGAAAASPMLDLFGNQLCVTSSETDAGDATPGDHSALPDCCTVACNMFAAATAADRHAHSLANPLVVSIVDRVRLFGDAQRDFALQRGPGSPRGPPLTV